MGLVGWFVGSLVGWLVGWLVGSLFRWFVGSLVGSLVPWSVGSLVRWLVCLLVGCKSFSEQARTAETVHKQAQRLLIDIETTDTANKLAQKHGSAAKRSLKHALVPRPPPAATINKPRNMSIEKWSLTQVDAQWIVAQWLLSSLTQPVLN